LATFFLGDLGGCLVIFLVALGKALFFLGGMVNVG
jgi:hypothetical protein